MKSSQKHIYDQIDAYRAGKLSDKESEELWAKLIENDDLMEYLVNSVNVEEIANNEVFASPYMSKIQSKPPRVARIFILSNKSARIAAVFLAFIGVLSALYLFRSDYVFDAHPISAIELDSYRSSSIPSATFDYELQEAINLASLEQYEAAIDKLNEMELEDLSEEQAISLELNKGSIYYNRGDYTAARDVFVAILDHYEEMHVLTEEQIHWFLGNVYLQLGREELAQVHIQKTYDLNGAYRRLAERYLD
ncbi:MAG: hypothetical protein WD097_00375 [Balneolales bacterium]